MNIKETVMKKLNLAIIGQGRSGKDIHGKFYVSEANKFFNVKYVVDADEYRRGVAEEMYPGCKTFSTYQELFAIDDIDLVVNSTFSEMHYPITKDLLLHGFNVLSEKPFARSRYECDDLIRIAKNKGVVLAVFQQTFLAPFYLFAKELIASGKIGELKQVSLNYSNFKRRWDWQTLLKRCAGSAYNTGPHPIGMALGFLDFADDAKVVYSKLDTTVTSGDGDDFCKIIIARPNGPLADVEIHATDAYTDYNLKLIGSKGTFKATPQKYSLTYIVDGENPDRQVVEGFLENKDRKPAYCSEELIKHTEEGEFGGTAFDIGTASLYEQLYYKISEGKPMDVTAEMASRIIGVIEEVHAANKLPVLF